METIGAVEDRPLERKSSIYQNRHMLAVRKGDEWVPISYDTLEGIDCDTIITKRAVLTDKPYIGYQFPVATCRRLSQTYIASDQKGSELKALPSYFGAGFYERYYDRDIIVNSATGALGQTNATTLRVGLDYVLAKETIDPVA